MVKVGIVVAVEFPIIASIYGNESYVQREKCYRVLKIERNHVQFIFVETGPGEIQAAAGTQFLIDHYCPKIMVNIGLAGGLVKKLKVGDICLVSEVVHTDYNVSQYKTPMEYQMSHKNGDVNLTQTAKLQSQIKPGQYPGLRGDKILLDKRLCMGMLDEVEKLNENTNSMSIVSCASQDKIIMGDEKRRALSQVWECQICDMELAGVALVALKNKVPLVSMKVVSDTIGDSYEEMENWESGLTKYSTSFRSLLKACENLYKY